MTTPKPRPSESLAELRQRAHSGHWNDHDWAAALISAKAECDRLRALNAEMLEALKDCLAVMLAEYEGRSIGTKWDREIKAARTAIAKAEGTIQ